MLLARAARRRAQEESRAADVARDIGTSAKAPIDSDKTGPDGPGLQIHPTFDSEGGGRREAFRVDDRSSDVVNHDDENSSERNSIDEVLRLQQSGEPVVILDVRTERSLETSNSQVKGAVRLPPEHVVQQARELNLPKDAWLIAYCA